MKRVTTALSAGMALAVLCGAGSLDTVAVAQDDGIEGIFDRARDRARDSDIFDRDRSDLALGATLLQAEETECQGALIASGIGRSGEEVHGIRAGEERLFSVADQVVPWACLGARTARSDVMECPNETTDVRISNDGNVARFECYGSRR